MATRKSRTGKSQNKKKKVARKPARKPAKRPAVKKKVTRSPAHEAKLEALRSKLGGERFEALKAMASTMLARNEKVEVVSEALTREASATQVDSSELYTVIMSC